MRRGLGNRPVEEGLLGDRHGARRIPHHRQAVVAEPARGNAGVELGAGIGGVLAGVVGDAELDRARRGGCATTHHAEESPGRRSSRRCGGPSAHLLAHRTAGSASIPPSGELDDKTFCHRQEGAVPGGEISLCDRRSGGRPARGPTVSAPTPPRARTTEPRPETGFGQSASTWSCTTTTRSTATSNASE